MEKIKVTLLGDSIRQIGYGTVVPEMLGDEFEVFQPRDNCRFSKFTLRGLYDWEKEMRGTRIVHWNNGLWDTCRLFEEVEGCFSSEEEYIDNMLKIADILLNRYDKVIFATTTPVVEVNTIENNEDVERYNEIIVPLLKEKGVIINDLYSLVCENPDKYIAEDAIHLSEEGIDVCGKKVVEMIKEAAKTLGDAKKCETAADKKDIGAPV